MKALALILCLFTLAACGNKKKDKDPEVDRRTLCDPDQKCLLETIIEVVTSHLPENIKMTMVHKDISFEFFNECDEEQYSEYRVTRGPTNKIKVFTLGRAAELEFQVIITDLGADCDQDVVFYDQLVTSEVVTENGKKPKMVLHLD